MTAVHLLVLLLMMLSAGATALRASESRETQQCSASECETAKRMAAHLSRDLKEFRDEEGSDGHVDPPHPTLALEKLLAPRGPSPSKKRERSHCRDARKAHRLLCRLHGQSSTQCRDAHGTIAELCYSTAHRTEMHRNVDLAPEDHPESLDFMFRAAGNKTRCADAR